MDRKEYLKDYYLKNKQSKSEYNKKYKNDNKNNPKYIAMRQKAKIKNRWKSRGFDVSTFYYVYPIYLNTTKCDRCEIEFEKTGNRVKCMDHCHATGMYRNTICKSCNTKYSIKNYNSLK